MKNFRSYGFWTAFAGAVTLLVGSISKCFGFQIESQAVEEVIMSIAGVLVVLGVVCIPTKYEKKEESEEKEEQKENKEENDEDKEK